MISLRVALASLATVALAGSAAADDSGNFVYRLGQDTTSVEHYTRSASKLELDQVGRAPPTKPGWIASTSTGIPAGEPSRSRLP